MNLDEELDRLYQLPLADFIGARSDLARRLRAEGDRDGAERVKKLVKPPLTAWVVNQLHFQARPRLDALLAAGEELRSAITEGAGAHQTAMKARREAIAELLAIAAEILDAAGQKLSRVHRQRLSRTLEALAGGSADAAPGRLDRDLEPPGFDAVAGLAASLTHMPRRPTKLELVTEDAEEEPGDLAEVVDLAAERQNRAQKAQDEKLARARRDVEVAAEVLAEIESLAAEAGSLVTEAERLEGKARVVAEAAERQARDARQQLESASGAVAKARLAADAATARGQRAGDELVAAKEKLRRLEERG